MPPTINGMRRPIEKIYTKLTKQTARGGRSLRPGQRVFDDIVQLAGFQLLGGAPGSKVGYKGAVDRDILNKIQQFALPCTHMQSKQAESTVQAQLGMEQLLTDDAVDEHDFHLLMVCYITERVDNKWELL